jgi:hypothetical protein
MGIDQHPAFISETIPQRAWLARKAVDVSPVSVYTLFMLARVYSCAVIGLDGVVVEVEVDYTAGFPGMTIVGLPDAAIQESRERVQATVRKAGVRCLVVNIAPAIRG